MNIEIANRLVNLRKQNNLSQEALAEKLGISRQAVSKWERAEASPDTDNLIMLAKLYKVSLDDLLQTEDEIPQPDQGEEETENTCDWGGEDGSEEKKKVHIGKDGIHVEDGEDRVHIGKDGIHVSDGGDEVHIGWDGIHVNDGKFRSYSLEPKLRFPVGILVCIGYLVVGIVWGVWHPGWLLLFLIPILNSLITAIRKRNASHFAYPVLALGFALAYLFLEESCLGFIALLTIPLYYSLVSWIKSLIRHRRWKKQQRQEETSFREMEEDA